MADSPPPPAQSGGELVDPERALAVAYAPADRRAALATLFLLDERLGSIVASTTEPMIGLMRLAWWREALEKLDREPAPAEPLLAAVAEHVLSLGVKGAELAEIEDGWAALLDGEEIVARHGAARGGTLFALGGRLLGHEDARVRAAGEGWALADLSQRHSDPEMQTEARTRAASLLNGLAGAWPGPIRALGALAVLARRDAAGEAPRRQGSPGRLARMLALRLTGR